MRALLNMRHALKACAPRKKAGWRRAAPVMGDGWERSQKVDRSVHRSMSMPLAPLSLANV